MAGVAPPSKHRALLRLRRKLTWRRYTKERGRIVGLILSLLFVLPTILLAAFGTWYAYTHAPGSWPWQVAGFMLVGIWAFWIFLPIVAMSLSDGIQLQRLLVYPLRRRDLVLSSVFGTLYDYPTWFALPMFVALIIGLGGLPTISAPQSTLAMLPLTIVVAIVAYANMVVTSQLGVTALGGILQSRRSRDVAIALLSLFGFSCWFISQLFARLIEWVEEAVTLSGNVDTINLLGVMQWFPTGALAKSLEQASIGAWGGSIAWLLYSAAWAIVIGYAWMVLLERLLTGEGFLFGGGSAEQVKRQRTDAAPTVVAQVFARMFAAETRAIFWKELRLAWRVPQRRIGVIQAYLLPLFMLFLPVINGDNISFDFTSTNARFLIPSYTIFLFWILGQNMLGWEHAGLPMLLLTPVSRRQIFLGKSLALLLLGWIPLALASIILTVLSGNIQLLFYCVLGLLMALPAMAINSIMSAWFPYPVQLDYKTNRSSFTRGGCLAALVMLIPVPLSFMLLNLPLIAPALINTFAPRWSDWAIPLALFGIGWAVLLFNAGIQMADDILIKREPEAIEAARPTKDD